MKTAFVFIFDIIYLPIVEIQFSLQNDSFKLKEMLPKCLNENDVYGLLH